MPGGTLSVTWTDDDRLLLTGPAVLVAEGTTNLELLDLRSPMLAGMDIAGTSALVTGAASGIGAAVARRLAGPRVPVVVVADLQADKGEALAAEIGGEFARVDVTDSAAIQAAVERAAGLGPLRVLVNSAGIGWAQRTIGRDGEYESAHDLDGLPKVVAINLVGSFDAIRLAATAMSRLTRRESGERGAIVDIASVAAFDGQIGQAAYAASKGGLVGLTLPVARDLSAAGDPAQHRRARAWSTPRSTTSPRTPRSSRRSSARACSSRPGSVIPRKWPRWCWSA